MIYFNFFLGRDFVSCAFYKSYDRLVNCIQWRGIDVERYLLHLLFSILIVNKMIKIYKTRHFSEVLFLH
jgi:hypothetical protein